MGLNFLKDLLNFSEGYLETLIDVLTFKISM